MNIYERIKEDHKYHRKLLSELAETSGDSKERRELFKKLKKDVESHANAEEQVFYHALLKEPSSQEQARHGIAEHKQTSDLIEELEDMDMSNPHWLEKLKKYKHDLEHHMQEEEDDVFPVAKKVLSQSFAEEAVAKFEARKKDEKSNL